MVYRLGVRGVGSRFAGSDLESGPSVQSEGAGGVLHGDLPPKEQQLVRRHGGAVTHEYAGSGFSG